MILYGHTGTRSDYAWHVAVVTTVVIPQDRLLDDMSVLSASSTRLLEDGTKSDDIATALLTTHVLNALS